MKDHDAMEQAFKNGYEKGKQDTTREIFEKIEETVENAEYEWATVYGIKISLAELKKKYIGEKK